MATSQTPITLEIVLRWAYSGHESDKVYRFLFLHPDDFFTIPKKRTWPIAHQVVYNGDVTLLRRILALFYDDQINIRTLSADKKTLLDVAKDRRQYHGEMYTYVEDLFLLDDLIQAAKTNHWDVVRQILEKYPVFANQKPPYSPFFLLHYIVQSGDTELLKELFRRFKFDTNVFSADLELPVDLARRLKRKEMCSILESTTSERLNSDLIRFRTVLPADRQANGSELPYPKIDPFPSVDFHNNSLVITEKGNYQVEKKILSLITQIKLHIPSQSLFPPTAPFDVPTTKDNQSLEASSEPVPMTPTTPASKAQLMRNLTCPLTQQIFVDPVIASDGQTYERAAITEYVNKYQCSPMTGVKMDATFTDNTEVKQIIQSLRR